MTLLSYSRFPPQRISTIIEATQCKADASSPLKKQASSRVFYALLCTTHRTKTEGLNSTWFRQLSTTTSLLYNKNHHLILAKKMGRKNHCSPTTGWFFPIHSKAFYQTKEANHPTISPLTGHPKVTWIGRSFTSIVSVRLPGWGEKPPFSEKSWFIHRKCGKLSWLSYMCHVAKYSCLIFLWI